MKKLRLIFSTVLSIAILSISIHASAISFEFDANYYARKYPDVAQAVGTSYDALYSHYEEFGSKEGRYVSQAEESYYFANNMIKVGENVNSTESKTTTESTNSIIVPYDTFVDVNITTQTVTYYENGVEVMSSPCVTGNSNLHRDTPQGTFKVLYKQTKKYLIGPTWKSYVDYWMRFTNTSVGLHDASWRSNFGGEIYKTNGSHGCVNLPKEFAAQLYEAVSLGTVVYVHE